MHSPSLYNGFYGTLDISTPKRHTLTVSTLLQPWNTPDTSDIPQDSLGSIQHLRCRVPRNSLVSIPATASLQTCVPHVQNCSMPRVLESLPLGIICLSIAEVCLFRYLRCLASNHDWSAPSIRKSPDDAPKSSQSFLSFPVFDPSWWIALQASLVPNNWPWYCDRHLRS